MAQKPQVLRGFRDLLPHRMRLTQRVIRTATDVFERFGFEPLATPALEYAETLAGKSGEETDTLFYRFLDRGQREIGLRYDLTVPLARVFAMHQDLGRPFKRYQIDKVWRAERPQRGRYREFYQCDADVVGSSSTLADAEVISIAHAALLELGFERFKIKINNRKLLVPLAERCQVPGHLHGALFRSVDKLEKIGPSGVEKELEAAGVPTSSTDRIFEMISRAALEEDKFAYAERELATTDQGRQGVTELREIWQHLLDSGVDEGRIALDLSLVRGMDYYTGPIFEAVDLEDGIGSIGAGGRYDRLIGAFSGQDAPAVGVSLGLERIVDLMETRIDGSNHQGSATQILVTVFSPDLLASSLRLATQLRAAGFKVEMYLNSDRLPNQLRYANRKGINYCTILGPDEADAGSVVLKDMKKGAQETVDQGQIVEVLNHRIAQSKVLKEGA